MNNMWAGRFNKELDREVNDFNSSIHIDGRMYAADIDGSIAHATMLGDTGVIAKKDAFEIVVALKAIKKDLDSGKLSLDPAAEDIHMFIEAELTKRLDGVGKKLHTARSRNDQVAVDTKLHLKSEIDKIKSSLLHLLDVIVCIAEKNADTIMPGYTHLQRAQPITLAHHLMAYASMLMRDYGRLTDCAERMDESPLGSCALAGTTHPIDRRETADLLGFSGVTANSIDGVSDRDYAVELAADISIIMMHLSRFSEEIILWCSAEFKFMELDDAYATGSSIMPQKKNPDIAELVRGKTGRAYGNLITLLTMLKGLPLAYNKDMQEDKEAIFDSVDTVLACLSIFAPMLETATFNKDNMKKAAGLGYTNATDVADYLAKKGVPFREAYKITGKLVDYCIKAGINLSDVKLEEFKAFSPVFDGDIYGQIAVENCVNGRISEGGPSSASVAKQLQLAKAFIAAHTK